MYSSTRVIIKKQILIRAIIVLFLFCFLNYGLLKVTINWREILMVFIITINTILLYGKKQDYLNPSVYIPILYFMLFWLGNFDFGFYPQVPQKLWGFYLLGIIGFYCGIWTVNVLNISKPIVKRADYLRPNVRQIFLSIYAICIFCKLVMYIRGGIPLFADNIDASRQNIAESFGLLKVIATAHTILAVYFFYDVASRRKLKKKIPMVDYIIIICSFGVSILDVSRLLIIQMLIPMVFIFVLKVRRIKLKNMMLIAFATIVFIGANKFIRNILENPGYLAYISANRNTNLFGNIMLSSFTSFRVGIDDLRQLVETVPSQHPFTYGQMFINSIVSVLPGKQVVMGYYVADLLGMNFDGIGASTTILGMFYLDGGSILIFIGMLLYGIFIQFFYKKYIEENNLSIYSLISVYVLYYAISALRTNVMPNIEPLLFMFYYIVLSYLARKIE